MMSVALTVAKNVVRRFGPSLLLAALAGVFLARCAPTQLRVDQDHPGSPAAESTPLPSVGRALEPDFESQGPASASTGAAPDTPGHHHGGQASPATNDRAALGEDAPPSKPGGHAGQHGASPEGSRDVEPRWTCPMHPQVSQPQPGNCPICGMKLKPAEPPEANGDEH
jgi:hypothetical protein